MKRNAPWQLALGAAVMAALASSAAALDVITITDPHQSVHVPAGAPPTQVFIDIGGGVYDGTLTLDSNDVQIGFTERLGFPPALVSRIQGDATTVTFRGGTGTNMGFHWHMFIGWPGYTSPVLRDADTGSPRHIVADRDLKMFVDNTYTGGTTVSSGKTITRFAQGLGTGPISIQGSGTGTLQRAILETLVDGFTSGPITVGNLGRLQVQGDVESDLVFAGGTISSKCIPHTGYHTTATFTGSLTDAGDITFDRGDDRGDPHLYPLTFDLTLSEGIQLTDSRTWTLKWGTEVAFDGAVTDDGGGRTLVVAGEGRLHLDGGCSVGTLEVSDGTLGTAVATAAAPNVVVAGGGVWAVDVANHGFGEVDKWASQGVMALAQDSSAGIALGTASGSALTLGSLEGDVAYTGALAANADGKVLLGGGWGRLLFGSALSGAVDLEIGWDPSDSLHPNTQAAMGSVELSADNSLLTGSVDVWAPTAITHASALGSGSVTIHSGACIDVTNTGHKSAKPANWTFESGAGVSAGGQTMTAADVAAWFASGDYVLGGAGDRSTSIADGALVGSARALYKIGPNTLELADPVGSSVNTYGNTSAFTHVLDGTLAVHDSSSLGGSSRVILGAQDRSTHGTLAIESGDWRGVRTPQVFNGTIDVTDGGTLKLYGLVIGIPGDFLTRGDLVIKGGTVWQDPSLALTPTSNGDHSTLTIADGGTLVTTWTSGIPNMLFTIEDTGTLLLHGNATLAAQFGTIMPGGTVRLVDGAFVYTNVADTISVFLEGSGSSLAKPYTFDIGAGAEFRIFTNQVPGAMTSSSAAREPVCYVRKDGPGRFVQARGLNAWTDPRPKKFFWEVADGTLDGSPGGDTGLSATVAYRYQPYFFMSHIEGFIVRSGAELVWTATHGFFDTSWYLVDSDGDGWLPGEFLFEDGATLVSKGLALGYRSGSFEAMAFPTVEGTMTVEVATDSVTRFRSGIEASGPGPHLVVFRGTHADSALRLSNDVGDSTGIGGAATRADGIGYDAVGISLTADSGCGLDVVLDSEGVRVRSLAMDARADLDLDGHMLTIDEMAGIVTVDGYIDAGWITDSYLSGKGPEWALALGIAGDDLVLRAAVKGDADCDHDVDASDLARVGLNWSPSGGNVYWGHGDFDGDGDVDATDLAALGLAWSPSGYSSVTTPVPEPAALGLGLAGAAGVLIRRRKA